MEKLEIFGKFRNLYFEKFRNVKIFKMLEKFEILENFRNKIFEISENKSSETWRMHLKTRQFDLEYKEEKRGKRGSGGYRQTQKNWQKLSSRVCFAMRQTKKRIKTLSILSTA